MTGGAGEIDGPEVFEDALMVVLDGDHVVRASPEEAVRGFALSMQGIYGDDTVGEVEASCSPALCVYLLVATSSSSIACGSPAIKSSASSNSTSSIADRSSICSRLPQPINSAFASILWESCGN